MPDEETTTGTGTTGKTEKEKATPESKRLDSLEQKVSNQDKTISQQSKTIEALTKQLEKATNPAKAKASEKATIPTQTFEVDKRKFKFVLAEFVYGEERMTALDALSDKDILADLVQKQSGVIKEIH